MPFAGYGTRSVPTTMAKRHAKSLAQLKIDAKRSHKWPWPIEHPNDERALVEGCWPDFAAAERVRRFFARTLIVPKETGGTEPFRLLDWWYRDVLAPVFGWKRPDGRRRFDKAFITTAKKSGKTTTLAGVVAYMLCADGEEEAEVYSAATDRDQAALIYQKTARSVKTSPSLKRVLRCVDSRKQILHDTTGSHYEAISSDADSAEGKNPHCLIVDELHVWKDRQFFNALMYGDIVRTQPLFLMITTAGDDPDCIGFEEYEFAKQLLDPDDPLYSQSHFAYIAEAGEDRDWDDPKGWLEAQPSLRGEVDRVRPRDDCDGPAKPRVLGSIDKLQAKCEEAQQSPRKKREFQRYICNRWLTGGSEGWIDPDAWSACPAEPAEHDGQNAWGGLDLSSTRDITSLCLAFWMPGGVLDLEWRCWLPEEALLDRERQKRVPLRDWVDAGWIELCPGPIVDYAQIRTAISGALFGADGSRLQDKEPTAVDVRYKLQKLGYDPWNARELCERQLFNEDKLPLAEFRQGYASMNEPCKKFERLVLEGKVNHGGNPVAAWALRNVVAVNDDADNVKLSKKRSRSNIDPIVAAVMAVGLASLDKPKQNSYRRRGVLTG